MKALILILCLFSMQLMSVNTKVMVAHEQKAVQNAEANEKKLQVAVKHLSAQAHRVKDEKRQLKKELLALRRKLKSDQTLHRSYLERYIRLCNEYRVLQSRIRSFQRELRTIADKWDISDREIEKRMHRISFFNTFEARYETLAAEIPEQCAPLVLRELSKEDDAYLKKANSSAGTAFIAVWEILNKALNLGVDTFVNLRGFVRFDSAFAKGSYDDVNLEEMPELLTKAQHGSNTAKRELERIVGNYKIHLMPHRRDMIRTVIKLLDAMKKDKELGSLIGSFKVRYKKRTDEENTVTLKEIEAERRMPRIVIYPTNGKENVEKALAKIMKLFASERDNGIDVRPRFNKRVNSFIFFAQGDGDIKTKIKGSSTAAKEFGGYFEDDKMVYYHPNILGYYRDFHLHHA